MPANFALYIYMSFLLWMVQQIGKSGGYVLLQTKIMVLKMNVNNCMCSTMYLYNHMEI